MSVMWEAVNFALSVLAPFLGIGVAGAGIFCIGAMVWFACVTCWEWIEERLD